MNIDTPGRVIQPQLSPVDSGDTTSRRIELFTTSGNSNVFKVGEQQQMESFLDGSTLKYLTTNLKGFYLIAVDFDDF